MAAAAAAEHGGRSMPTLARCAGCTDWQLIAAPRYPVGLGLGCWEEQLSCDNTLAELEPWLALFAAVGTVSGSSNKRAWRYV